MIDENEARKHVVMIEALQRHADEIETHIAELDDKTIHLRTMVESVADLTAYKAGTDILAPITQGIYFQATLKNVDTLFLNVGADTMVEKSPFEATKLLESQMEELSEYRKKLTQQSADMQKRIGAAQEQAAEKIKDVR